MDHHVAYSAAVVLATPYRPTAAAAAAEYLSVVSENILCNYIIHTRIFQPT